MDENIAAIKKEDNINTMVSSYFNLTAENFISEQVVARGVRKIFQNDADGNRTDVVIGIAYDCIDPDLYSDFTIKVETNKPVVSPEELATPGKVVCLKVPVAETLIKPYSISYGKVKVSIVAPYVQRVEVDK